MQKAAKNSGFTLIELMVVVAIIGLLLTIVIPSTAKLFTAGAENSARNLINAQLAVARGLAIRNREFAGVHFQRSLDGKDYVLAVVEQEPTGLFTLASGFAPATLPGGMGCGQIGPSPYLTPAGDFGDSYQRLTGATFDDFTTFTVLFNPEGRLWTASPDSTSGIVFDTLATGINVANEQKLFVSKANTTGPGFVKLNSLTSQQQDQYRLTYVWDSDLVYSNMPNNMLPLNSLKRTENGVRGICLFDAQKLSLLPDDVAVQTYLNENAQFLPVNPYTGGLIRSGAE